VIVSSNLRRAISTALFGFWDRLQSKEENLVVLPCLQEITTNPDAIALSAPFSQPPVSWIEMAHRVEGDPIMKDAYEWKVDMAMHTGSKAVDSNG
jgi:hypothetical protein